MLLIVFVGALASFAIIYGFLNGVFANRIFMEGRLENLQRYNKKSSKGFEDELQHSFLDRIIKPLLGWVSGLTQKFTSIRKRDVIEKRLLLAGKPWNLDAGEFISLYYGAMLFTGFGGFLIAYGNGFSLMMQILVALWGAILGRVLVDTILKSKVKGRQQAISRELPDVLDLLTVSVEAGLGFDGALQKVIQKTTGPIAYEFHRTLQEIKMGKPRREALKDLGERTGEEDLNSFISAIVQADQLGVSIGNVLRIQSKQMRQVRKQRVEEKAMKAPIKMLLPMLFFIFPAIFLVLLGPAIIQLIENM